MGWFYFRHNEETARHAIAWLATVAAAEITQNDQVPQNVSCTDRIAADRRIARTLADPPISRRRKRSAGSFDARPCALTARPSQPDLEPASDSFMVVHRAPIILLAARNSVPAVYELPVSVRDHLRYRSDTCPCLLEIWLPPTC
jgi:hypothetical protein